MAKQTSVFPTPSGLGKAQKSPGVPANLSNLQYASTRDSISSPARYVDDLGIPLALSLLFCLSLQLGISLEQDALRVLIYALAAEAVVLLEASGVKGVICILTGMAGLTAVSSLLAQSLFSFYNPHHAAVEIADGQPRPMFFPVQTSHTRLFPKVHSLSYPFMWTGIPIGFRGNIGGVLSCESKIERIRPAWFTIDSCDYVARGNDHIGLDGKLHEFLISQGVDPKEYPYAYLLTASKFSGHAFNPVSFWYLYSATRNLCAVILEVNNTFGERHSYFLSHSTTPSSTEPNAPTRFTSNFRKDFFVSPFSDRSGSYSLVTNDPLYPNMAGIGPIKLCLTLSSDAGKPKVVARVYSNDSPVDPTKLSWWQVQRFAMSKAWDTWATEPRTVYQAGLLMFKRGLSIFTVPEPLKTSISRKAKDHEIVIEGLFRQYLKNMAKNAKDGLLMSYMAAGIQGATAEVIVSPATQNAATEVTRFVAFRVLTPAFYSRMVRYETVARAMKQEARQGQTLEVEGLDELLKAATEEYQVVESKCGLVDRVIKFFISLLRRGAKSLGNTKAEKSEALKAAHQEAAMGQEVKTAEATKVNSVDDMGSDLNEGEIYLYRMAVLKLLLSDWVALGNMDLLALERFIVRVGLMWMVGNGLQNVLHRLLSCMVTWLSCHEVWQRS